MNKTYRSPVALYHFWTFYLLNNVLAEAIRDGLRPRHQMLDDEVRAEGRRKLAALGVSDDEPLIALHVREAGYANDASHQAYRNASIQNYLPAIAYLTARGYTVVRLGDQSMTRLPAMGPKVIDAANAPVHQAGNMPDSLFELYVIERAHFFLGMSSGPMTMALTLDRPMLSLNTPISWNSALPNPRDLIVFRSYRHRQTGRTASFLDVALNPIFDLVDAAPAEKFGFLMEENPADLIVDATAEMLHRVKADEPLPANARDVEFRRHANWFAKVRAATLAAPDGSFSRLTPEISLTHRTPTFALPWVSIAQSFYLRNPDFLVPPVDVAQYLNPGATDAETGAPR